MNTAINSIDVVDNCCYNRIAWVERYRTQDRTLKRTPYRAQQVYGSKPVEISFDLGCPELAHSREPAQLFSCYAASTFFRTIGL